MLSRISALAHKSAAKYQVLKLTSTQTRVMQQVTMRNFTPGSQPPTSDVPQPPEGATQPKQAASTQDDYNLDEVASNQASAKTSESSAKASNPERKERRSPQQPYQKREPREGGASSSAAGGLNMKQKRSAEEDAPEKQLSFEDYKQSKAFSLQQEIFNLIKTKIGSSNKDKVQRFYTKLQEELKSKVSIGAVQRIDDLTIRKIQALILEQKTLDDKTLFEDFVKGQTGTAKSSPFLTQNLFPKFENEYYPLRYDMGDTQKMRPLTSTEYEALAEERQDRLMMDELIDDPKKVIAGGGESTIDDDDGSANQEIESRDEIERYNEMLQGIREQFFKTLPTAEEKTIFDFDRLSNEVQDFKSKIELEEEERQRALGTYYEEHDVDQLTPEFMDKHTAAFKIDKEGDEEFEDAWSGLTSDLYSTMREDLKGQYDQARLMMKLNQQLRMKILYSVKTSKTLLSQTQKQKERLVQRIESHARDFQSDVIPKRVFDFIAHEKHLTNRAQQSKQHKKKLARQYLERQFDHNTSSTEHFNNELSILVNHFKLVSGDKKLSNDLISQMTYVVELLHKNQIHKDIQTKARLFEYGVISRNNEFANQQLKQIVSEDKQHQFSVADPELLNQFYTQSLKSNNFNGLGHLMTYLEKYGIDISAWNINSFKAPLEFNLNQQFNLGNVLVFTKYYTYFHTCRFGKELKLTDKPISEMNDAEKFALNRRVFNAPGLVDMRSLFGYLVQNLGTKQAIDPVTKDDALWRIVDFFTQRGINDIASFGENSFNTLSESDLSQYLANRINDTKALDKLTQTLLRLGESETVHNNVLQSLKEYTSNNNNMLPESFEVSKIRSAYLRLKALNAQKKATFSEKNIEYFLYLFRQQKMWAELIDTCESFQTLTGSSANYNDIVRYYLSDSLLQLPVDKHYCELIQSAVFDGKEETSAAYVTAMTKAHLKDGSIDHALKFFEAEVAKLRDIRAKREDVLVALFDSAYAIVNSADANISFDEFKNRYLDILSLSNDLVRESYAVNMLSRVIKDKQYEEIDTLFQHSLVVKQENLILAQIPAHLISGTDSSNLSDEALSYLNEKQLTDLNDLNDRKQVLQSKLNEADVKYLTEYLSLTKEKKLGLLDELEDTTADKIQQIFNIKSKNEVEAVLKRTERFSGAVQSLRDNNSDTLDFIWQKSQDSMARALKKNMKEMTTHRDIPDRSIDQIIDQTYNRKKINPIDEYENNDYELQVFNDFMLEDEIYDENDPFIIRSQAHDQTLADMREELLQAINARKGKVLASALKIFNKVQDQQLKSVKLSTVENLETENIVDGSKVSESLQKFNILFNDPRSPVYSAVQTLAQYKGDKGVVGFSKLYRDMEDFFRNRIDLEHIQRERDQLEALSNELQKSQLQIKALNSYILKEQQEINKEVVLQDSVFAQWKSGKDRTLASSLQKKISEMYNDFKGKGKPAEDFSREEKLKLMKDVFSLEFGHGEFASSQQVFPSFYCQDLIIFGMENNIAEAVRLGEKMMSENGYTLSLDMQKALKEFLLNNAEQYQQAMKRTGPIDNTSLYKRVKQNADEVPIMLNMDDPYWQDFISRNSARTQQWRVPSHMAWDHKQFGIVGEVVDIKRVIESQNQFKKYF